MQKQKIQQPMMRPTELVSVIGRLRSEATVVQVIGHVVIWVIISAITLGIGAMFWPYAAAKLILESVVINDEMGDSTARLRCTVKFSDQLGHAVLWLILIALTGGLAGLFYPFAVAHIALNRTELISI